MMNMSKACLLVALLGFAAVCADESVADNQAQHLQQLMETLGKSNNEVPRTLGAEMTRLCRNFNDDLKDVPELEYAEKLADESSREHQCGIDELEKGEYVLSFTLRAADPKFRADQNILEHLDRVRDRLMGNGVKVLNRLATNAIDTCEWYVQVFSPFVAEVKESNTFNENPEFVSVLRNVNACNLLMKNGISKVSLKRLSKWSAKEYKEAKQEDIKLHKTIDELREEAEKAKKPGYQDTKFQFGSP